MDHADADALVARLARREGQRGILLARPGPAGSGVQDRQVVQGKGEVIPIHHVHPGGQGAPEGVVRVVDRALLQGVVVAGQEDHRPVALRSRELAGQGLPPLAIGGRLVEQIAGAQDGVDAAQVGGRQDPVDHVEPRPGQGDPVRLVEAPEPFAEVPVGGVQQLEGHVVNLPAGHAISNSTSAISSMTGGVYRRSCAWRRHRW